MMRCVLGIVIVSYVLGAGPAFGQRAAGAVEPVDTTLDTLIAALDSPVWSEREVASAALAISDDVTLADLVARLGIGGSLTPEQRSRVWAAAETRFLALPAPGLGVGFNGRAVTLNRVLENFPAAEVLRAGDEILEVHREPVSDSATVRAMILGHLPGEKLPMLVRRRGAAGEFVEVEVDVELGSYAQLGNPQEPDVALRRSGFRLRVAREIALPEDRVIGATASPIDWLEAEGFWPPPAPDTPIGETGITRPSGTDVNRWLRLAGQGSFAARPGAMRRADGMERERRLAQMIGDRAGSTEYEEVLAAYRITLLNLASIDERFLRLDGVPGEANAARLNAMQRERTEQMDTLTEFAEIIQRGPEASIEGDG